MAHAELSPSSAVRWMSCPGSVALCRGLSDTGSTFAAEGTTMHTVAELCLTKGTVATEYVGQTFVREGEPGTLFTDDLATAVQRYVDYVNDVVVGTCGTLMVEQRLPISGITGETDAHGTSDTVILADDELIVVDLKGGMGEPVFADHNPQLQIYALAALREFSLVQDFKTVRMVIHQPRLNSVSEFVQTVGELEAFALQVMGAAAATTLPDAPLVPSTKGCRWCKAKATCPALSAEVTEVFEAVDPDDVPSDDLAAAMNMVERIEGWCKAIRAETERRLLDGREVFGWKLVQGRKGSRAWTDKAAAEALLKHMRVPHDQMYDYSVISPTSADKLAKAGTIGPRQWPKVQELITQADGKPSVAPASDKRPELVIDEFAPVSPTDLN